MQLFQPVFSVVGLQFGVVDCVGVNRTGVTINKGDCVALDFLGSDTTNTLNATFGDENSSWAVLTAITDAMSDGTTLVWWGIALTEIKDDASGRIRLWGHVDEANFIRTAGSGNLTRWTRVSPKPGTTANDAALTPDAEAGDIYIAWYTGAGISGLTATAKIKGPAFIDGLRLMQYLGAHA